MSNIPAVINGVAVELAPNAVGQGVHQRLVDDLKQIIRTDVASGHHLERIWISSARDSHHAPSRHVAGKAIDISRINGRFIYSSYNGDAAVAAIVNAIQTRFEAYPHRRENFGPYIKKKSGNPFTIGGHADHIHLSVN